MITKSDSNKYINNVTILIEIHAKDGQEDIARQAFTTTIETAEKPGLLSYEIFEDTNDPGAFYSMQKWESAEAFHTHMSAAKNGLKEAAKILRDAPRTSILKCIG